MMLHLSALMHHRLLLSMWSVWLDLAKGDASTVISPANNMSSAAVITFYPTNRFTLAKNIHASHSFILQLKLITSNVKTQQGTFIDELWIGGCQTWCVVVFTVGGSFPVCAGCKQRIYDEQYLQALNTDWHTVCFRYVQQKLRSDHWHHLSSANITRTS